METQINGIKSNGHYKHPLKGVKRSAASIRKQVRSAARNRRIAAKAGLAYGRSPARGKGGKPRLGGPAKARKASGNRIGDALTYCSLAQSKALEEATGRDGSRTALEIVGLLALAIAALEGRD